MKEFWFFLTIAAVGWYIFVTAYVSVKGVADIREMLHRLNEKKKASESNADAVDS